MKKGPFILLVIGIALMNAACALFQICLAWADLTDREGRA